MLQAGDKALKVFNSKSSKIIDFETLECKFNDELIAGDGMTSVSIVGSGKTTPPMRAGFYDPACLGCAANRLKLKVSTSNYQLLYIIAFYQFLYSITYVYVYVIYIIYTYLYRLYIICIIYISYV